MGIWMWISLAWGAIFQKERSWLGSSFFSGSRVRMLWLRLGLLDSFFCSSLTMSLMKLVFLLLTFTSCCLGGTCCGRSRCVPLRTLSTSTHNSRASWLFPILIAQRRGSPCSIHRTSTSPIPLRSALTASFCAVARWTVSLGGPLISSSARMGRGGSLVQQWRVLAAELRRRRRSCEIMPDLDSLLTMQQAMNSPLGSRRQFSSCLKSRALVGPRCERTSAREGSRRASRELLQLLLFWMTLGEGWQTSNSNSALPRSPCSAGRVPSLPAVCPCACLLPASSSLFLSPLIIRMNNAVYASYPCSSPSPPVPQLLPARAGRLNLAYSILMISQCVGDYNYTSMIKMLRSADWGARRTFAGTALIKFATGVIGLWGTINIYFFSYLRNAGTEITPLTNSIIMLCAIIPASFAVLLSTRLTSRFGYRRIVRASAVVFALSPYLINLGLNEFTLGLFYLFIPITCFAISSIPILNCLWSQFPSDLNKVSGSAVLFFALGMIVWNITFSGITNPHNEVAEIDANKQAFFKKEISDKIFLASNVMFLCSGLCFLAGSFLIEKKNDSQDTKQMKLAEESPPEIVDGKGSSETMEARQEYRMQQRAKLSERVRETLRDRKFVILFCISMLVPLYLIYMSLYMKLIFLPIINDDHFLAFCSVLLTVSAIFGAPFWGYVGDTRGFKFTLLTVLACDFVVKVFGVFCQQKWNLMILYFCLGFNDKGILTIVGPGLIEIFGLEMATQLIPFKGISLFLAYVAVPLTQIFFAKYVTYQVILVFFIGCSLVAVALAHHFYSKVEYKPYEEGEGQVKTEGDKVEELGDKVREFEEKNIDNLVP